MSNVLRFRLDDNRLKLIDGFVPVNTERNYSQICVACAEDSVWATHCALASAGFFATAYHVVTLSASRSADNTYSFNIPFASIGEGVTELFFGMTGSYTENGVTRTVASNIVRVSAARGALIGEPLDMTAFQSLMAALNDGLALKENVSNKVQDVGAVDVAERAVKYPSVAALLAQGYEHTANKAFDFNGTTEDAREKYPSVAAVYNYLGAHYYDKDTLDGEFDRIDDDISDINTALAAKANAAEVSAANLAVYRHLSANYYDKDELDGEIDRIDDDISDINTALAAKANTLDVNAALAAKADAAATLAGYGIVDAYDKAQVDKMMGLTPFTVCNLDLYDATLENDDGNVILFLFGYDNSNSPTCGLDKLTAEDYGKVWHIVLTFTKANLAGSKSVRVQEHKRGAQSAEDWQTYNNVAEGNVIRFDYTMSDSTVSILRLRLNARVGEQKVHVLITSNRQLDDVLDTKANAADVNTALAAKANAADVNTALAAKANAADVNTALAAKADAADVNTALAAKADAADVNTALAAKADAADVNTALAAKANAATTLAGYGIADAYTKAQADEIRNTALFTMYDNDLYDAETDTANSNVILFLFGYDNSNSPTCGLDKLTAEDYGKVWHIVLTFTKANLAGSKSVRVQEHKRGAQSAEDWQTYNNVAEGNVIRFDYTMSDSTVSILRLRLNARVGEQKVHVTIAEVRQLDVVLDAKVNTADVTAALAAKANTADVTAALATKADANPLPAYCLTEIERVKTAVAAAANYGDVVFGLFTDLHFRDGANANDEAQKWNAIRCVRKIADESILDFVIQGGDLMTGGNSLPLEDYERDTYVLNRSQYEFNGSRAPLYTSKGDHDSNQSDTKISKSDFAKRTAPYMPKAVRSSAYPNNYYFDLPEKKTRVINIDTGTVMAGQSGRGDDYTTWTNEQLFNWLLDEVLTEEVKTGWRFIIFSHAPCDYEWQFGMTKQFRSTHPNDTTNSQNAAKGNMVVLNDLLEAINSAGNFSTEKTSKHYELVHDSNRVLQEANETAAALGGDVYTISGIETTNYMPFVKTKNFSGWTSKARLILSGHCHCDRLNNSTLIPDGNGNYLRGNTSYAIAYTASAAKAGFKSTQIPANSGKTYYNHCFGNNASDEHPGESAANAAWSHIQSRAYGEISEQLFDIWIVGGTYIKRVRFGAGAGSELLATSLEV